MDTLTILLTSLLCFWALILVVTLQAMQGLRTLRSYQKYLNLCSEDERRFYGFGTTWEWVINDRIFIFGWTNPLRHVNSKAVNMSIHLFVHLSGCIIRAPFGVYFTIMTDWLSILPYTCPKITWMLTASSLYSVQTDRKIFSRLKRNTFF